LTLFTQEHYHTHGASTSEIGHPNRHKRVTTLTKGSELRRASFKIRKCRHSKRRTQSSSTQFFLLYHGLYEHHEYECIHSFTVVTSLAHEYDWTRGVFFSSGEFHGCVWEKGERRRQGERAEDVKASAVRTNVIVLKTFVTPSGQRKPQERRALISIELARLCFHLRCN